MKLDELMVILLDNACGSSSPDAEGFVTYIIDVHCMDFYISARKIAGQWEIKSVRSEDT